MSDASSKPVPPTPSDPDSRDQVATAVPEIAMRYQQIAGKIVHFNDLATCGDEVWIELDGQLYRLRKTRNGKLLLSK